MTVAELITELQKTDPNRIVVLQKDAEGNGYSPLAGADCSALYVADSTWSGEVYDEEPEDPDADEDRPDETAKKCVVLWPVN